MTRSNFMFLLISVLGNLAYGFSSPSNVIIMSGLSNPITSSSSSSSSSSSISQKAFMSSFQKKRAGTTILKNNEIKDPITHKTISSFMAVATTGGGAAVDTPGPLTKIYTAFASLWASTGVVYILMKAIKRVLPVAMEPLQGNVAVPLSSFQLVSYVGTCLFFAYAEGYKGFQKRFSPLVVSRSFTLEPKLSKLHHTILAPLYAMGLFHATKKRMIVSWSVSIGVAAIVAGVKRLSYPWRNIVDAGVVVGLSWGALSILIGYVKALFKNGYVEGVDPCLPN